MSLTLNSDQIIEWIKDNGNETHNLIYPLNENSVVLDLGGYKGKWAEQIINLYNPYIYLVEPIKPFFDDLSLKFKDNPKVKILNAAVSSEDGFEEMCIDQDSSSFFTSKGEIVKVEVMKIDNVLNKFNLNNIDLLQINIEGYEYKLLEYMVESNLMANIKYMQIQFHQGIENYIERRDKISDKLFKLGFTKRYDYPFVWEGWQKT